MADEGTMEGGRLEVPVEADLTGFARELKTKVETAAENVAARIDVAVDESGLRQRLHAAVKKASAGLAAEIDLRFNRRQVARQLGKTVAQAATKVPPVPVDVRTDTKGNLPAQVARSTAAAQATADANPVEVPVEVDRRRLLDSLNGVLERFRRRAAETAAGGGGGGGGGGLLSSIFSGGAFSNLFRGRGGSRFAFRFLIYGGLVSLIQPIVAALGQLAAGLVAVVGAAAPALGVIGALPGLLAGLLQTIVGLTIAFSGVGQAIGATGPELEKLARGEKLTRAETEKLDEAFKNMAPEVKDFAVKLVGLKDEWIELRKDVQKPVFAALARQIEPVAERLLPVLRKGFVGTSKSLGRLIDRTAEWMDSRLFAKDAARIMRGNNLLLDHFGNSMLFLAQATTDFLVASQPFLRRVGEGVERFGEWVAEITAAGRESGKIERFLERAGDKAKQVGTILIDLTRGFFGIFSASVPAGEQILERMERRSREFAEWANGEGKDDIRAFFDQALPGFFEMVRLIGEIGRALGRMMKDPNIDDVIAQVTDQLLPAVEDLLTTLGQEVGPKVIDFLSSVVEALDSMAAVGGPLGVLVEILDTLVDLFNLAADVFPPLGPILGTLLGSLLAFRILKPVLKPIVGFFSLLASGKVGKALSKLGKGGGLAKALGLGAAGLGAAGLAGGRGGRGGGLFGRGVQRVTWGPAPLPVYMLAGPGVGGGKGKKGGGRGRGGLLRRAGGAVGRGFGGLLTAIGLGGLLGGGGGGGLLGKIGGGAKNLLGKVGKGGPAGILASLGVGFLADKFVADGKGGGRDALAGGLSGAAAGAGIGAAVGSIIPVIGTGIGAAVGGLAGGIIGVVRGLGWDKVKNFVGGKLEELKTGALTKGAELLVGLREKWEGIKNGALTTWEQIRTGASTRWEQIKTTIGSKLSGIKTGAVTTWEQIKTGVATRVQGMVDTARTKFGEFVTTARTKFEEFGATVREKFTSAVDFVASIPGKMATALGDGAGALLEAGKNLASSLADGIKSGAETVAGAAESLGSSAVNAAKWVLGIGSPSKVFTDFGGWVARGLAGGIAGSASRAVNAATQMARSVAQAGLPQFGVGDLFQSQRLAAAGLTGASAGGGTVFNEGAIQVNNPVPERASDSLTRSIRNIVYLGFGGDD